MAEKPKKYDLLIKNVRVVRPRKTTVEKLDIAVSNGKVVKLAKGIAAGEAREVVDGKNKLAFPGLVDPHMHTGIYGPLSQDARSESLAAAQGGVTSSLNYMRTGGYYMERGGPYAEVYPEVLAASKDNFWVDYAYHLAPLDRTHIGEIDMLINKFGVTSFKIFMFYGSHGLHGASNSQKEFLMIGEDERYDLAHFEFIMRGIQAAREQMPDKANQISLSLHCETAEIMTAYTKLVEKDKSLKGLAAYSASRPQHSEGLAVFIASYLANETALPNINLLHLSSRKAVQAAMMMADVFPHIDFKREVTIGHLMLDITSKAAELAKVNPPIRPREDVEFLWQALLEGELDWVVSDHACCRQEMKVPKRYFGNIWMAKSGFGGTEYLLPSLVSEGTRRGMDYNHMARVLSWNPAQRYGLNHKGDIAEGFDADVVLVDPNHTWTIHAKDSPSTQGYTPFEGLELSAHVDATFLRGKLTYEDGQILGKPSGQYLHRPTA